MGVQLSKGPAKEQSQGVSCLDVFKLKGVPRIDVRRCCIDEMYYFMAVHSLKPQYRPKLHQVVDQYRIDNSHINYNGEPQWALIKPHQVLFICDLVALHDPSYE